jgi:hypothetical protein
MYDTAQEAFQLAIDSDPTLVEAHIGRLLGFVYIYDLKVNLVQKSILIGK